MSVTQSPVRYSESCSLPRVLFVFRYIMTATKIPVLQKPELDAFLVTAFSPEIGNHKYLAEMTLDYVTTRGVQLATMFMEVRNTRWKSLFLNSDLRHLVLYIIVNKV